MVGIIHARHVVGCTSCPSWCNCTLSQFFKAVPRDVKYFPSICSGWGVIGKIRATPSFKVILCGIEEFYRPDNVFSATIPKYQRSVAGRNLRTWLTLTILSDSDILCRREIWRMHLPYYFVKLQSKILRNSEPDENCEIGRFNRIITAIYSQHWLLIFMTRRRSILYFEILSGIGVSRSTRRWYTPLQSKHGKILSVRFRDYLERTFPDADAAYGKG